jgi:hypothetical protein
MAEIYKLTSTISTTGSMRSVGCDHCNRQSVCIFTDGLGSFSVTFLARYLICYVASLPTADWVQLYMPLILLR